MKRPLLLPLVPLYATGLALRELRLQRGWETIRRLRDPVISIGNLSTGGSGKTPLTIALARLLSTSGFGVDVLSRGYGRSSTAPSRVDPSGTSDQYGDEPLVIAREAGVAVFVAAERYEAGRLAESDAPSNSALRVHILDDGFQHRRLSRDVDLLLVNREDWHDHLLPAGNLRESLDAARRANVIAIPADDPSLEAELRTWGWTGPIWRIRRRMNVTSINVPVLAFCGIARPEQFLDGLRAGGMALGRQQVFADHHRYTMHDIETLVAKARSSGLGAFVTTEKDKVRLGNLLSAFPPDLPLRTIGLSIEIDEEQAVLAWIERRLADAVQPRTSSGTEAISESTHPDHAGSS